MMAAARLLVGTTMFSTAANLVSGGHVIKINL